MTPEELETIAKHAELVGCVCHEFRDRGIPTCPACEASAILRRLAARIRELEALLADVYREATEGDTDDTVARHIDLGAPEIAFPALNQETTDE